MSTQRATLDSPLFAGRLRDYSRHSDYERRPVVVQPRPRLVSDILPAKPSLPALQPVQQQVSVVLAKPNLAQTTATVALKREIVAKPQIEPKPKRLNKTSVVLVAMAVTLFAFGASVAFLELRTNSHVAAQVKKVANTSTSGNSSNSDAPPSENKPNNLGAYVVPPDQPRFLKIPKLSVDSRVLKLGVKTDGELQTPNNIYDTGWYQNSAKPGDAGGAILIDGHVHGPTQPGVFYGLKNLQPGDTIQIERGDGKLYNFKVVKSQSYPADKVDMNAALVSVNPNKLGLNLITCTGSVNTNTDTYNQRLIVFAVAD